MATDPVTKEEIQTIRAKHHESFLYPGKCHTCFVRYQDKRVDYPCDVVKVLNYYEQNSDCKHMVKEDKENHELDLYAYHLKNWQYCPLCGEKL